MTITTLILLLLLLLVPLQLFVAQETHQSAIDTNADSTQYLYSTVANIVSGDGAAQGAAAESCTAAHCNERGTCFGTKAMPLCLCQLGFAGVHCQDTYCDSARDCSGRGWCMGTSSQFSCLCNLGFAGERCDKETPIVVPTVQPPPSPTPAEEAAAPREQPTNISKTSLDSVAKALRD